MWDKAIKETIGRVGIFNREKEALLLSLHNAVKENLSEPLEDAGLSGLTFCVTDEANDTANEILQSDYHVLHEGISFPYIRAEQDDSTYTVMLDLLDDMINISLKRTAPDGVHTTYDFDSGTWIPLFDESEDEEYFWEEGGLSALLQYLNEAETQPGQIRGLLKSASSADYQKIFLETLKGMESLTNNYTVRDKKNPFGYIPDSEAVEYAEKTASIIMRNFINENNESLNAFPVWVCVRFGEEYHQGLKYELAECQTVDEYLDVLADVFAEILFGSYEPEVIPIALMDYSYDYAKLCITAGMKLCATLSEHIDAVSEQGEREEPVYAD